METRNNSPIGALTHRIKKLAAASQESTPIPALSPIVPSTAATIDFRTADQLTDALFSGFNVTRANRILVISPDHAGYGDLLFGLRTCQLLQTYFPSSTVTLVTTEGGAKTVKRLQGDKEFGVTVQSLGEYTLSADNYPDLIIEAPVFSILEKNLHALVGSNTDILLISEYGANNKLHLTTLSATEQKWNLIMQNGMGDYPIHTMHTGLLSHEEDGVLITDELVEEQDRKTLWNKVSSPLRQMLLQGRSEEEYDRNSHMSISYTSEYNERAIAVYGEFEKESGKDADIIFLGKNSDKCVSLSQETRTSLLANGFTTVVCQPMAKEETTCYMNLETGDVSNQAPAQPGRTFRILYASSIPHPQLMVVSKLAGPFRATTGDQSQGENYSDSNASILLYEAMQHKHSFIKGMRILASQYESRAPGITRAIQLLTYGGESEEIRKPFTDNMLKELGVLIRNPVIQRAFSDMHKKIRADYNLGQRIAARVNRILITNEHLHLAERVSDFYNACTEQNRVEEAANALFESLQNRHALSDSYVPDYLSPLYRSMAEAIQHNDYAQFLLELKALKDSESEKGISSLINQVQHICHTDSGSDTENGSASDSEKEAENSYGDFGLPANLAVTATENMRIMKVLLENGLDVNQADHRGLTPLHVAAKHGKNDIAALLIEHGAQVNRRQPNSKLTALHFAAAYGNLEMAKLLLARKADVNAPTKDEETALHLAAAHNNLEMVKLLVEKGAADITARNKEGKTPVELCEKTDIKKYLEEAGMQRELHKNHLSYYGKLRIPGSAGMNTPPSRHRFFDNHFRMSGIPLPSVAAASIPEEERLNNTAGTDEKAAVTKSSVKVSFS